MAYTWRVITFSMSLQLDCEFLVSDAKCSRFKSLIGIKPIWTVVLLVLENIVRKMAIKRPYVIMMCYLSMWPLMLSAFSLDSKNLHIPYTLSGLTEACNTSAITSSPLSYSLVTFAQIFILLCNKIVQTCLVWREVSFFCGALSLPVSSEVSVRTAKKSPCNCTPELPFSPLVIKGAWVNHV